VPFDQLLLFVAAGLLLNLTPGPDVLYIVSNALRSGARAGMAAALGASAGVFVHIFAAAIGVSALLVASSAAFAVLKWLGAAYLVYGGLRLLFSQNKNVIDLVAAGDRSARATTQFDFRRVLLQGFWTNALNPKVALFFLAFLPQFIGPTVHNKPMAFLLLGLLFNFNCLWVNLGWAVAAAWLSERVGAVQSGMAWLDRAAGVLFVTFGLKLALTDNPTN
jgi:threonine/homoserine/homoserine lactone efflux protein